MQACVQVVVLDVAPLQSARPTPNLCACGFSTRAGRERERESQMDTGREGDDYDVECSTFAHNNSNTRGISAIFSPLMRPRKLGQYTGPAL